MLHVFHQGQFGRRKIAAAATDPNFANVRFLLHFEGADASTTFSDNSPVGTRPIWAPTGNAQIDTAQFKYGSASGLFDGTGDYLTDSTGQCLLGTADLTVEAFVRLNATGRHTIVDRRTNAGGYVLDIGPSTEPRFFIINNAATFHGATGATTLSTGVWYHLAGTISGTTIRIFVNGTQDGSGTFSGTRGEPVAAVNCYIGTDPSFTAGRQMNGWIDEVRGTNGVARYTANFTPPAAPFPNS